MSKVVSIAVPLGDNMNVSHGRIIREEEPGDQRLALAGRTHLVCLYCMGSRVHQPYTKGWGFVLGSRVHQPCIKAWGFLHVAAACLFALELHFGFTCLLDLSYICTISHTGYEYKNNPVVEMLCKQLNIYDRG